MRSVRVTEELGVKSQDAGLTRLPVANFLITSLKAMFALTVKPPSSIVEAERSAAAI